MSKYFYTIILIFSISLFAQNSDDVNSGQVEIENLDSKGTEIPTKINLDKKLKKTKKKKLKSKLKAKKTNFVAPKENIKKLTPIVEENLVTDSIIIAQTNAYIQNIIDNDPGSKRWFNFRSGAIQIINNSEGPEFSSNNVLPLVGVEWSWRLFNNISFDGRVNQAINVSPTSDLNGTSAYQRSTDFGLKYSFILDKTRPTNFLAFKINLHNTENNFILSDPTNQFYLGSYKGYGLVVEKGVPITHKISLLASLDLISFTETTTAPDVDTAYEYKENGFGFTVRGEVFYKIKVFGINSSLGLAYWQSGYVNEFLDVTGGGRELTNKKNNIQTYRMISGSFNFMF